MTTENTIKNDDKTAARNFIELIRAKEAEQEQHKGARPPLTPEQETKIALAADNLPKCQEFNDASEIEIYTKLLSGFEKLCLRNDETCPDDLREDIAQILHEELRTNFWTFAHNENPKHMEKYVAATLHNGSAITKAPAMEKYKDFSEYMFVFNKALVSFPSTTFKHLDNIAQKVDQYKDDPKYAILRQKVNEEKDGEFEFIENDTLYPIIYAASNNPETAKEFLDTAVDNIENLHLDPKYNDIENP